MCPMKRKQKGMGIGFISAICLFCYCCIFIYFLTPFGVTFHLHLRSRLKAYILYWRTTDPILLTFITERKKSKPVWILFELYSNVDICRICQDCACALGTVNYLCIGNNARAESDRLFSTFFLRNFLKTVSAARTAVDYQERTLS